MTSDERTGAAAPKARRRDADILAAAIRVFYERGYASSTVQHVADELGMLKGSLYHYIDSKEDLLFRLFLHVHVSVDQILTEIESDDTRGSSSLDLLRVYVHRQVEFNLQNVRAVSVYYHDLDSLTGDRWDRVVASRRRHDAFVSRQVEGGRRTGEVDGSIDTRVLVSCIFASIVWTYRWFRPGRLSEQEVAKEVAEFTLRGVMGATGRT